MKKALFAFVLMNCMVSGFAKEPSPSSQDWPKGAIRSGTLSDQILVADAMLAARSQANVMGCDQIKDGRFFIKKDISGKEGEQTWEEIWQFQCNNGNYNVQMSFMESKKGGVNYTASSEN